MIIGLHRSADDECRRLKHADIEDPEKHVKTYPVTMIGKAFLPGSLQSVHGSNVRKKLSTPVSAGPRHASWAPDEPLGDAPIRTNLPKDFHSRYLCDRSAGYTYKHLKINDQSSGWSMETLSMGHKGVLRSILPHPVEKISGSNAGLLFLCPDYK